MATAKNPATKPAPKPRDSGPLREAFTCVDCAQAVMMFQSEIDWWNKKVEEEDFKFPTRCKKCREKRKQSRERRSGLSSLLREIAAQVENSAFTEVDQNQLLIEVVPQELNSLAATVDAMVGKPKELPPSVGAKDAKT